MEKCFVQLKIGLCDRDSKIMWCMRQWEASVPICCCYVQLLTFLHAVCRDKYTTERKTRTKKSFMDIKQEKYSTNNHADFM